jgi:uridine kinase
VTTHLIKRLPDLSINTVELATDDPITYDYNKFIGSIDTSYDITIIHGLYTLYSPTLRQYANIKVFVDCDSDTRLNRLITREVLQSGKELTDILNIYLTDYKVNHTKYIENTRSYADVRIKSDDGLGIELIVDGIMGNEKGRGEKVELDIYKERFYEVG